MHICLSLQSPSLKEKDLPNILASPLSEGLCPPDSSTAAKQFPPCPSPANTSPDCLYRKSQTLPQNCPELQLSCCRKTWKQGCKLWGEEDHSRGNNGWKMSLSDKKQTKANQKERGDNKTGHSVSLDPQHTQSVMWD